MNLDILNTVLEKHLRTFGHEPDVVAYAPGRVEILGNHTDYNNGLVLSCAINAGTFFTATSTKTNKITINAPDVNETVCEPVYELTPSRKNKWANYIKGVIAQIIPITDKPGGINAMFLGDIPIGSGLSSSAALEISTGLAVSQLWGTNIKNMDLARIGQKAEHDYAGAKCGLLDQISSLYGRQNKLVHTDFRSLKIKNVSFSDEYTFMVCNTHAKHALVDGEYNERRASCEAAVEFFKEHLNHPVAALRDVNMREWNKFSYRMDHTQAKRALHIIGENDRVKTGIRALKHNDFETFGRLMFESHASSQDNFENSCKELDFIVETAKNMPSILGARLSGGGFGGSVIMLLNLRDVETAAKAVATAYRKKFGQKCDTQVIVPSHGARIVKP